MIRKSLGRGLGALLDDGGGEEASGGSAALMLVAPDRIAPAPFQPRRRFDEERLQELTRAIESQGVIEPLVVRRVAAAPGYELVAGERRLRAARRAGLALVPVVVRELDDRAALEMSLVENLAREELGPIDEARAFLRLSAEFGLSHEQIAGRIGKSRPHVSNTIRLLDLPEPVLAMLERGELSAGQARPLLGLDSAAEQVAAARRIVQGAISARGAERIAAARRGRPSPAAAGDPNLLALAESLQRALKRKVRIVRPRGKAPGRIEIDYYDDRDLTALAQALSARAAAPVLHDPPA